MTKRRSPNSPIIDTLVSPRAVDAPYRDAILDAHEVRRAKSKESRKLSRQKLGALATVLIVGVSAGFLIAKSKLNHETQTTTIELTKDMDQPWDVAEALTDDGQVNKTMQKIKDLNPNLDFNAAGFGTKMKVEATEEAVALHDKQLIDEKLPEDKNTHVG